MKTESNEMLVGKVIKRPMHTLLKKKIDDDEQWSWLCFVAHFDILNAASSTCSLTLIMQNKIRI